jgi:hypothetical protein
MGANLSLIPELEEVVQRSSPKKRVETLQRITARAGQGVVQLANDDDIVVAGPVLKLASRLAESDLVDLARTKGPATIVPRNVSS